MGISKILHGFVHFMISWLWKRGYNVFPVIMTTISTKVKISRYNVAKYTTIYMY